MGGRAWSEGGASQNQIGAREPTLEPNLLAENTTQFVAFQFVALRRNLMNALQIIPPKPVTRIARSRLLYGVSGLILLLALVGGMSMSRGEEGTAFEPDAAVAIKDGRDQASDNDKSISVTQPAVAPAAATTGDSSGGGDEKLPASAQPNALSVTSTPAGVENDPKVGSEAVKPVAAETKSNTASSAATSDRNTRDRNHSRALAKLPLRQAYQSRGEGDDRSRKPAGRAPVWAGPPPVIYGPAPEAMAPYAIDPAGAAKTPDRMLSPVTGMWRRVVAVPVAVLDGGKQALYGVIDSIW
jgi:hypothetical protein